MLAVGGLAWVVIAVGGDHARLRASTAIQRRTSAATRALGNGPIDIALTFVTRPWDAVAILATPGRIALPGRPAATAAAAAAGRAGRSPLVALPQLVINLFASTGPAQTVDYHYAVLLVPFLVAAALLGLAQPARARPRRAPRAPGRPPRGRWPGTLVGAVLLAGVFQGPLPLWGWVPGGWGGSARAPPSRVDAHARALRRGGGR